MTDDPTGHPAATIMKTGGSPRPMTPKTGYLVLAFANLGVILAVSASPLTGPPIADAVFAALTLLVSGSALALFLYWHEDAKEVHRWMRLITHSP